MRLKNDMRAIETLKKNGKTIEIHIDDDPQNPRKGYCDHDDLMVCFHRRMNLGDEHDYRWQDYSGWDELEAHLIKEHKPVLILPVYMFDHSGITISTKPFLCPWDSGQIGYALMSREAALKAWGVKRITAKVRKQVEAYLLASVEEYDLFLRNEIYGYVIRDENGKELDSCWGFYGLDYTKEQALEAA